MNLIFLFSLPRSGSTFCQRILGAHEQITTVNEPHFLLPFLYAHKDYDVRSTYNHHYSSMAIQDFIASLPNQKQDYDEIIRNFAYQLYQRADNNKNTTYFLDKTPKYHFVADEIMKIFPEAKILFLWRNPLAILASLLKTWGPNSWNLYHFYVDLYQGVERLICAYKANQNRVLGLRYEDLVLNPEESWSRVFSFLDLSFDPQLLTRFSKVKLEGRVTDPNSMLENYQFIQQAPLQKWKQVLANPLRKAWSRRYLRWIGQERLAIMGYDLNLLMAELNDLPLSWHQIGKDLYKIPLGTAYHIFEIQLMKQKLMKWRAGERVYMHN